MFFPGVGKWSGLPQPAMRHWGQLPQSKEARRQVIYSEVIYSVLLSLLPTLPFQKGFFG